MRSIFPLLRCQRNILLFFWYKTRCKTRKNTCDFHLYCSNHVCKASKLCFANLGFVLKWWYAIIASRNAKRFSRPFFSRFEIFTFEPWVWVCSCKKSKFKCIAICERRLGCPLKEFREDKESKTIMNKTWNFIFLLMNFEVKVTCCYSICC